MQNLYKKEAQKLKGVYHITTDTPEFERMRKLKDELSEVKYREALADFTAVSATPEMKQALKATELLSKVDKMF